MDVRLSRVSPGVILICSPREQRRDVGVVGRAGSWDRAISAFAKSAKGGTSGEVMGALRGLGCSCSLLGRCCRVHRFIDRLVLFAEFPNLFQPALIPKPRSFDLHAPLMLWILAIFLFP